MNKTLKYTLITLSIFLVTLVVFFYFFTVHISSDALEKNGAAKGSVFFRHRFSNELVLGKPVLYMNDNGIYTIGIIESFDDTQVHIVRGLDKFTIQRNKIINPLTFFIKFAE